MSEVVYPKVILDLTDSKDPGAGIVYVDKESADEAIAALEAENKHLQMTLTGFIDMSVCNERCPAYQQFTTIFESPERAYGGCVVAYTDSNFHKDRAPLGEACPFYREESDQ